MVSTTEPRLYMEHWGGFECSIVRVGEIFRDQLSETGHWLRDHDIEAVAQLGITRLRYTVHWERVSPVDPHVKDWSPYDKRLQQIRNSGMHVIAGFVHHGSGPRRTNLLDPEFPKLLAEYARCVARRYPWISDFTPVNEPLTTARFSALYGHWFPHARSEAAFLVALFHQCRGIALSMAAVRGVTPHARLIQTEDLGRVFSAPDLRHQAEYENERRWLSFDLLTGRVTRQHDWFARFLSAGVLERQLLELADAPCSPQMIGINHYLTSDRFLDDDLSVHSPSDVGGNGQKRYADIAAPRAGVSPELLGFAPRLKEAWERYGLPIAITEVHNGCTRDEQLRWLMEAWRAIGSLRDDGVDVRAFTAWSLMGSVDWNSLLTQNAGHYESGVFDARCTPPRPTVLAHAVQGLTNSGNYDDPLLCQPGWWHRVDRLIRPAPEGQEIRADSSPPLLIAGATGTLGAAFALICRQRGLAYRLLHRSEMDIANLSSVRSAVEAIKPWAVINAAGFARPSEAAPHRVRCLRENATGPAVLAQVTGELSLPLVTFSSDLVFDGLAGRPYVESDATCPIGVYGESKVAAERYVIGLNRCAIVIRTAAFFGPWDAYNFAKHLVDTIRQGQPIIADDNTYVSPTYVPDLVNEVLDLLVDRVTGIWHVANDGEVSWFEFGTRVAMATKLDLELVRASSAREIRSTALRSERGIVLPSLDDAVERFANSLDLNATLLQKQATA